MNIPKDDCTGIFYNDSNKTKKSILNDGAGGAGDGDIITFNPRSLDVKRSFTGRILDVL